MNFILDFDDEIKPHYNQHNHHKRYYHHRNKSSHRRDLETGGKHENTRTAAAAVGDPNGDDYSSSDNASSRDNSEFEANLNEKCRNYETQMEIYVGFTGIQVTIYYLLLLLLLLLFWLLF